MLKDYFAGSYTIRIILGALFAAIVADGVITRFLVHNGLASEANPFLQYWLMEEDKLLSLKILGGMLASMYLWSIYRRHPRLSIGFSSLFLAIYTFIIFWNLHILF
ncbi:MAG: DUF5658 family protein [Chloroflexota bacterium]